MSKEFPAVSQPKAISVLNEATLLQEIIADPASIKIEVRDLLMSALQSQAGLASLEIAERRIVRMSLNTHKALASECVQGGYAALNDFRKKALERLTVAKKNAHRPSRQTLEWYRSENEAKTAELLRITADVAEMGQKLREILELSHEMAKVAGKEDEFLKKRNELFRKFK